MSSLYLLRGTAFLKSGNLVICNLWRQLGVRIRVASVKALIWNVINLSMLSRSTTWKQIMGDFTSGSTTLKTTSCFCQLHYHNKHDHWFSCSAWNITDILHDTFFSRHAWILFWLPSSPLFRLTVQRHVGTFGEFSWSTDSLKVFTENTGGVWVTEARRDATADSHFAHFGNNRMLSRVNRSKPEKPE